MERAHGFTLIEMMVVIALIAIMATVAVPNFTIMVKNNRLTSQANSLIAAVNLARSEAIKRNSNIVICRSADGANCASSDGWEQGWIVYVDADTSDGTGVHTGAGDVVLREYPPLGGGNTLRADASFTGSITYVAKGFSTASGTLVLCDDRNSDGDTTDAEELSLGKAILISATGRPRLTKASNTSFSNCITP
jgi:type IV fimbrial biogenesis protein FimT